MASQPCVVELGTKLCKPLVGLDARSVADIVGIRNSARDVEFRTPDVNLQVRGTELSGDSSTSPRDSLETNHQRHELEGDALASGKYAGIA